MAAGCRTTTGDRTSGTVSVETAYSNHPIVKGLPVPWDVKDEWFLMNRSH